MESISNVNTNNRAYVIDMLCPTAVSGLFAYPFDYTKFINCKDGSTAIQNCIPNTAFNINRGQCEPLDEITVGSHVGTKISMASYEYGDYLYILSNFSA